MPRIYDFMLDNAKQCYPGEEPYLRRSLVLIGVVDL